MEEAKKQIEAMLKKSPHLKSNDALLVANFYAVNYPHRFSFSKFWTAYAGGEVLTHPEIVNLKNEILIIK